MGHSLLATTFVFLAAGVVAVPIARRLGLGSVLGYLLAGLAIGPHALGLVADPELALHFSEFGVVMMLFLIGLELRPSLLWKLRVSILGLGGLQLAFTVLLTSVACVALGLPWRSGVAVGCILAMSSTALVLQSLQEKGWNSTPGGRSCFSVLLFQDIAVIPILALLPLLAVPGGAAGATAQPNGHAVGLAALPAWMQALAVLGAVALVLAGGRYLTRPAFRFIAKSGLREVFTAAALLLIIGIALLMQGVGLSPALGTFLAGVVLADNEYRHELEGDIEPFKGLLLGVFFISVGAGVDLPLITQRPGVVLGILAAIMSLKALVLLALSRLFRLEWSQGLLFALGLSQVGEFAFVLLTLAQGQAVLSPELSRLLVAAVALSMLATPLLFILLDKGILPRFSRTGPEREPDAIQGEVAPVLIAGFGRVGNIVGRLLRANGIRTTVLDVDPDMLEAVRKVGLQAHYGDATRLDLLQAAGAGQAKLLVIAVDNPEKTLQIAEAAQRHFPHLRVLARVPDRPTAYTLLNRGLPDVVRETQGSALELGYLALRYLGVRAHRAHRAMTTFKKHDDAALAELAPRWGDEKAYFSLAREKIAEAEDLLRRSEMLAEGLDQAWDNSSLREAAKRGDLKR